MCQRMLKDSVVVCINIVGVHRVETKDASRGDASGVRRRDKAEAIRGSKLGLSHQTEPARLNLKQRLSHVCLWSNGHSGWANRLVG
jgi:hypothetical protein